MKIIVDKLPKEAKDCVFAYYVYKEEKDYSFYGHTHTLSRFECLLRPGLYPVCRLDCEGACPYLKELKGENNA